MRRNADGDIRHRWAALALVTIAAFELKAALLSGGSQAAAVTGERFNAAMLGPHLADPETTAPDLPLAILAALDGGHRDTPVKSTNGHYRGKHGKKENTSGKPRWARAVPAGPGWPDGHPGPAEILKLTGARQSPPGLAPISLGSDSVPHRARSRR